MLKVRVRAAPSEGEANDALVRLIAKAVGVPPRAVNLISRAHVAAEAPENRRIGHCACRRAGENLSERVRIVPREREAHDRPDHRRQDHRGGAARPRGGRRASAGARPRLVPGLAVVLVGNNPASEVYVGIKDQGDRRQRHALVRPSPAGDGERGRPARPWSAASTAIRWCTASWCSCRCRAHIDCAEGHRRDRPGQGRRRLSSRSMSGGLAAGLPALAPCTPLGCIILAKTVHPIARRARGGRDRPLQHRRQAARAAAARRERHRDGRAFAERGPSGGVPRAPISCSRRSAGRRWCARSWIKPGATVIDVGITRVPADERQVAAGRRRRLCRGVRGRGRDHAGAGRRRADDDRVPARQHRARGLHASRLAAAGLQPASSDERTNELVAAIAMLRRMRVSLDRVELDRTDYSAVAVPGVGDLVEHLGAEPLRGARDRAAAQRAIELDRGLVVRQRPDHEALQAALREVAARRREQLAAEAEPLEFRPQIELVDLAVVVEAARAVAAVVGVARDRIAEREDRDAAALADGAVPPVRPAAVDQPLELRARDDALIGGPPGVVMRRGDRRCIGRLGAADLDEGCLLMSEFKPALGRPSSLIFNKTLTMWVGRAPARAATPPAKAKKSEKSRLARCCRRQRSKEMLQRRHAGATNTCHGIGSHWQ